MILFIFLVVTLHLLSADVIVDTIRRVQQKSGTPPCEDFYRHACPLGSRDILQDYVAAVQKDVDKKIVRSFSQVDMLKDFAPLGTSALLSRNPPLDEKQFNKNYSTKNLLDTYRSRCQAKEDNSQLLAYFEKIFTYAGPKLDGMAYLEECSGHSYCATQLINDEDCERGYRALKFEFDKLDYWRLSNAGLAKAVMKRQETWRKNVLHYIGSDMIQLNEKVRNGLDKIEEMLEMMKPIFISYIEQTRWVKRNHAVEMITNIVNKLKLQTNFVSLVLDVADNMKLAENYYRKCKYDIDIDEIHVKALCFLCADSKYPPIQYNLYPWINQNNAFLKNPLIGFSIPFLLASDGIENDAGQFGLFGTIMAHEVGHSIIEDFRGEASQQISFFSKDATACIQNTFNNTCHEFKEKSCEINDIQVDENGADIIASQVAYQMFKDHYKVGYNQIYPPLNVTNDQIFFYSMSSLFCSPNPSYQPYNNKQIDPHSAENIRANVMAQVPEFREAFGCSADSRMVRVIKEPCYIYGPNAPEMKLR